MNMLIIRLCSPRVEIKEIEKLDKYINLARAGK